MKRSHRKLCNRRENVDGKLGRKLKSRALIKIIKEWRSGGRRRRRRRRRHKRNPKSFFASIIIALNNLQYSKCVLAGAVECFDV